LCQLVVGKTCIPDGCPNHAPVVVPLLSYPWYTFAFDKEGPANLLFLVHVKHLFSPITVSSPAYRIPPVRLVSFHPSLYLLGWVLFILAFTRMFVVSGETMRPDLGFGHPSQFFLRGLSLTPLDSIYNLLRLNFLRKA
jgi:hypothetical protein